jgi:hypothetical protein
VRRRPSAWPASWKRHDAPLGFDQREAAPRRAHQRAVHGGVEVGRDDGGAGVARGQRRGVVDQVREVRARHALGARREFGQVHLGRQRLAAGVQGEDRLPLHQRGAAHMHAAVEAAGAEQRGIQVLRQVGRGQQDDAVPAVEAVEAGQQLGNRLRVLPVAAGAAGHAGRGQGVDLVEEQDAGGVAARLLEQAADAHGADADEHLGELRAGGVQEGHAGLARQRGGEARLAVAGRAVEQDAAAGGGADGREARGLAQVGDDVGQFRLRLLLARDVGEGPRAGRELARAVAHAAHLPRIDAGEGEQRQEAEQGGDGGQPFRGRRLVADGGAGRGDGPHGLPGDRRLHLPQRAVAERDDGARLAHQHLRHLLPGKRRGVLAEGHGRRGRRGQPRMQREAEGDKGAEAEGGGEARQEARPRAGPEPEAAQAGGFRRAHRWILGSSARIFPAAPRLDTES